MEDVKYISFSSSGTAGAHFLGVIDALEDKLGNEWIHKIVGVAGTSGGCFAALVFALHLPSKARTQSFENLDAQALWKHPDLSTFVNEFGMMDTSGIREVAYKILLRGGLSAFATFSDIFRLFGSTSCLRRPTLIDNKKHALTKTHRTFKLSTPVCIVLHTMHVQASYHTW